MGQKHPKGWDNLIIYTLLEKKRFHVAYLRLFSFGPLRKLLKVRFTTLHFQRRFQVKLLQDTKNP